MTVTLPQIVVSRDGERAVSLESFGTDLVRPSNFDGFPLDSVARLRSRGERFFIQFRVSNTFQVMWNAQGQRLKWNEPFSAALPDLALIAVGRFLDDNAVPADPADGELALTMQVSGDL